MWCLFLLLSSVGFASEPGILDPKYDEFEGVQLVLKLARENKPTLARDALNQVPKDEWSRFQGLQEFVAGLNDRHEKNFDSSVRQFQRAIAKRNAASSPQGWQLVEILWELLESQRVLGNFFDCAETLKQIPFKEWQGERNLDAAFHCASESKQMGLTYQVIQAGKSASMGQAWQSEELRFLLHFGLVKTAKDLVYQTIIKANSKTELDLLLRMVELFEGQREYQLELIEALALFYPRHPSVLRLQVSRWHEQGNTMQARRYLSELVYFMPQLQASLAESYRISGQHALSAWSGMHILDEEKRLQFKLASAIDEGRWQDVLLLEDTAMSSQFVHKPEVRYALAFAHFRQRNWTKSLSRLSGLEKTHLTRKADALRREIENQML